MRKLFVLAVVAGAATSANAFQFRARFVERVGNVDTVIAGNELDVALGGVGHRIRIQFGVFDDAGGAAPAGGFVGWNVGTISVSGDPANSQDRRTNGRISPFNFATGSGANGNPPPPTLAGPDAAGFDFQMLTDIDATLGTQSPIWQGCDANGDPVPQPPAVIRGLNTYVSVYEITTTPSLTFSDYTITYSGNLVAASTWNTVGTPQPPDCSDPSNPQPGSVTYAPFPLPPEAFSSVLTVHNAVPGPGSVALLGLGGLIAARRRRA